MDPTFEQNIPFAPMIAGFVVVLLLSSVVRKKLRRRKLFIQGQLPADGIRVPSIEERVAVNPAWASGEIRSAGRGLMIILWIGVLAWNLTIGIGFIKSFSNPALKMGPFITLGIFALIGVALLAFVVRMTLRQFRFGNSWCCIDGKAGVLGSVLTGHIRTTTEIRTSGDYTIELQCLESYSSGSGKNSKTVTDVHWQKKESVTHTGLNSRSGIPFSFPLPAFPPETGCPLARGDIHWNLRIQAPVQGVDYFAMFTIPVFRVEQAETIRGNNL